MFYGLCIGYIAGWIMGLHCEAEYNTLRNFRNLREEQGGTGPALKFIWEYGEGWG